MIEDIYRHSKEMCNPRFRQDLISAAHALLGVARSSVLDFIADSRIVEVVDFLNKYLVEYERVCGVQSDDHRIFFDGRGVCNDHIVTDVSRTISSFLCDKTNSVLCGPLARRLSWS